MKKIFLIVVLFLPLISKAQSELGLKFGFGVATGKNEGSLPYGKYLSVIGVEYSLPLSSKFYLKTGLEYQRQVFKQDLQITDNTGQKLLDNKENLTRTNSYLNLLVIGSIRFASKDEKWIPFVDVGLNAMIKIAGSAHASPNVSHYSPYAIAQNMNENNFILGLNAGLGIKKSISEKYFLALKANYNYQIISTFATYEPVRFNPVSLSLSIGYNL